MNAATFGVNCWWTVPGIIAPVAKVHELLEKHGFEMADIAAPSDRVEVSRAVRSFQNRRKSQERRLAELSCVNGDSVVYGILDRQQDGEQTSFQQSTTIKYDKNYNSVQIEGSLAVEVQERVDQYKDKITDADIRNFLRRVVRMCQGVSKRPTGGIYFIPAPYVGIVEQANSFLQELQVGAKLYVERVMDGQEERKIVWEAVETDLDGRLEVIMAGVDRIERRVGALKNGEERVEELRELMMTYQELLGQEAEYQEMAGKLDKAVQVIAEKMVKFQELNPAPEPKEKSGYFLDDFDVVVKQVLENVGVAGIGDLLAGVSGAGYTGKLPSSMGNYLSSRIAKGELVRVGRGQYALASMV